MSSIFQQLINLGIEVTLTMSPSAFSKIKNFQTSKFIFNLTQSNAKNGTPFSHVIYSNIKKWVDLVDKKINAPSTLFFIQPTTVFYVYYYRFKNYSHYFKNYNAKDKVIELT
ncbi:hypothetical protein H5410_028044 [Solanum commersonii]|uniref:Uncharacterized protein n=1 Tax=Solanum commersonii TaxID=4109 RepID=A0A9J5Z3P4_SOLCO|nr:hypothetical protein H5410_028044 [Solanum commersonii]